MPTRDCYSTRDKRVANVKPHVAITISRAAGKGGKNSPFILHSGYNLIVVFQESH